MQVSLYEKTTGQSHILLQGIIALDFALAATFFFAWSQVAPWVDPILVWALDGGVGQGVPNAFDYPFVVLWFGPSATGLASWMLLQLKAIKLAWPVALLTPTYTVLALIAAVAEGTTNF